MHHKAILYIGQRSDLTFNLFGIDIFSARGKNHILTAPHDEEIILLIEIAQITGAHPAVLRKELFGRFGLFVVTLAHIQATHFDFVFPFRHYTYLHFGERPATRMRFTDTARRITDKRPALGHTVANGERESDSMEKGIDFGRQSSSTGNYFAELAAKEVT